MKKSEIKNGGLVKNNNQPQNQKPFDVVMNEHFEKCFLKGFKNETSHSRTWFIPIVKEQSLMDDIMDIKSQNNRWYDDYDLLSEIFPKILLEVNTDDEENISSIYVLYSKGGKLYRVVSQKDYGIIKSRMELKNGKYVPYEKCDLEPYNGVVKQKNKWGDRTISSISYKNGVKDGECITYYKHDWKKETETTTYKNGKKNGLYSNTKYNVKGKYLDNKKVGEWLIKETEFKKLIYSSYQKKYNLKNNQLDGFIRRYFESLDVDGSDGVVKVNFVNNTLHGDFEYREWKGKIKNGLFNGVLKHNHYGTITSYNYVDGIKNGFSVKWEMNEGKREIYTICEYEQGEQKSVIKVMDKFLKLPKKVSELTEQYMNEDLFYTIVKNQMNNVSEFGELKLDDFLCWNVLEYQTNELKDDNSQWNDSFPIKYHSKTDFIKITIEPLLYGISSKYWKQSDDMLEYFQEEFNYPYKDERDNIMIPSSHSNEYGELDERYIPKYWVLKTMNDETKIFINNEWRTKFEDEYKVNPQVLDYQKRVLKSISDKMKIDMENELKCIELEKRNEEVKKQLEREEKGLSLNSFPMD